MSENKASAYEASSKAGKHNAENMIPAYEHLFDDEKQAPKRKTGILYKLFKMNRKKLLSAQLVYIVKASPVWIMPIITAEIINIAAKPYDSTTFTAIAVYTAILVIVLLQNVPTHVLYAKMINTVMRRINAGMKSALVRKLQRLSITYHKEIESGRIQSKFLRDLESVDAMIRNIVITLIPAFIGVLISIGISTFNAPVMTLFFIAIVPVNIFVAKLFGKRIKTQNREFRLENESVSAKFTSMLTLLPVTKAHGLERNEINSFDSEVEKLMQKGLKVDNTNAYFGSWSWVISNIISVVCLIFSAFLAVRGVINVGDIVLYQALFGSINGNVLAIINSYPALVTGSEAISSVSEIMISDDVEHIGRKKISHIKGNIAFNHVCYSYPDDPESYVINDFSLDVKAGECIAVVGQSGSGKSTVMNLIIGFLKPTEGHIYIDGVDMKELDLTDYRHQISVVPQNSILFPGTIRENITYGLQSIPRERLENALELANINEFVKSLPRGLDTPAGEAGGKLSGGQRQRITIARALIRNPKILILDEATSALDNLSEYHVQQAIEKSKQGRTTFIVAHRLSTIRSADRIVVMEAGRCVEIGTYDELMAKRGRFYEMKALNEMSVTKEEALE
ncbi:MAG: ABC transporter ATP-binding protein [Eubacteriales bacterium]|nr:ABC transporter ATP-binding protein [Eubacteriales bacterium]